ncbi:rhodanese-like domain-containing protein [Phocaeicola abscessus]|uniref:rhodanese-like domain-containing protein n=1 Tax=Phocaeicola abscessus TaxID=555313 RepID=UPI0028EADB63|nr:rhodanese-like domain-containing protein [Phocaeicola abscessus]
MKQFLSSLMVFMGFCLNACSQEKFATVGVDEFDKIISEEAVQLVDVRTKAEFMEGHLKNAVNIDVKKANFMDNSKEKLDKRKIVAVYCRSGKRSVDAANLLTNAGYRVVDLDGGIMAWKAKRGEEALEKPIKP